LRQQGLGIALADLQKLIEHLAFRLA